MVFQLHALPIDSKIWYVEGNMEESQQDKRSQTSKLQITKNKAESVFTDPETSMAITTIRNLPSEISDRDVLILMLAVNCSPDAVALAVDPPTTGKEVRSIIYQYRPYFDELKKSSDKVLRCLMEDSMMITLARVRTGLINVKVNTARDIRSFMNIYMMLREVCADMPMGSDRTPQQGINRLDKLQTEIDKLANIKQLNNSKED